MIRRILYVAAVSIALSGCAETYQVMDLDGVTPLATCHDGFAQSFCRVVTPLGTEALPGGSLAGAYSNVAQTGAMIGGMGAAAAFMGGHH